MLKVTLRDEIVKEFPVGTTIIEVAKSIGAGLAKAACAGKVDGVVCDLRTPLTADCHLEICTFDTMEGKKAFWHTASHVLAQAVKNLYPSAKVAIGPATDSGFYYDFQVETPFTPEQLLEIEKEMAKIVKADSPLVYSVPADDVLDELFKDEPFKQELIAEHRSKGEAISIYQQEGYDDSKGKKPVMSNTAYQKPGFADLCAGPHLMSTGACKAIKLLSCTGAYWRGDSNKPMLSRIYGVAFPKAAELTAHLEALEDAKRRDHNKIGRELGYFTTVDYIGQGLPILMPKGAKVLQLLQRFVEDEEERRGYLLTKTPFMAKSDLYKISGHWDHYRDGMFVLGDEDKDKEVFALRPMTCPFQFQVYLASPKSYRDLPLRYNETSTLFRNESSGEMHGLIRLRQFTISEGHVACTPDQVEEEFAGCVDLAKFMIETLGLGDDISYQFSKWDPNNTDKYIGAPEEWEKVQNQMRTILDDLKIDYKEEEGEAAFYGPKLDIQIKNVHGKEDTLITVQIDFQLAERFGMEYVDSDGQKKFPYVLHRTSIGCYERTLALLLEKYAGALPTWLAPTQAVIMPINDSHMDYCKALQSRLRGLGVRVELDGRNEKIGFKIRQAQLDKTPYMIVIGDNEVNEGTVSVRSRKAAKIEPMATEDFVSALVEEIATKAI